MKKLISLAVTSILVLSTAFSVSAAEVKTDFEYNIIVNGKECVYNSNEAINVDGSTMLLADVYVNNFHGSGLTAESVKSSGNAYSFNDNEYYALRDVASANSLSVFWDKSTSTAIVADKAKLAEIKSLVDSSSKDFQDMANLKADMQLKGNVNVDVTAEGTNQSLSIPMDATIQMDLGKPFMYMDMKISLMGTDTAVKLYDDGEFSYTYEQGSDTWIKTESTVNDAKDMSEQLKVMAPSMMETPESALAALTLTKQGDDTIIEGNMYVASVYEDFNLEDILSSLPSDQTDMLAEMNFDFDLPSTMYVKYVFDKDNNIKDMAMKYSAGFSMGEGSDKVVIHADFDFNVPKLSTTSDFNTTVPQDVKDKAVSMEDFINQAEAAAAE